MINREDIIRMAREAGLGNVLGIIEGGALHRFFYMAQAAEREACAKLVEALNPDHQDCNYYDRYIAAAIRERSANAGARGEATLRG